MDKAKVKLAIKKAKDLVSDEEEPWKSLAFQIILAFLISEHPPNPSDAVRYDRPQS